MLMKDVKALRWSSASLTDAGAVRKINQDACLDRPEAGLWVVADGVGGHNEGEIASHLIVDSLSQTGEHARLSEFVDEVEDRLHEVHRILVNRASGSANMIIGSTVAALLVHGQHGVCLWAGDSRIYRYRDGALVQITRDHSHVEELIEGGTLQPEDADKHPYGNVITRAVGAGEELFLEAELLTVHHADRYLICSDGLYKEVNEAEIAGYMRYGDCVTICRTLVALALERGANDNVTVVVVNFNAA